MVTYHNNKIDPSYLIFGVQVLLSLVPALLFWMHSSHGKAITAGKRAQNQALDLQGKLVQLKGTGSLTEKSSMTVIYGFHGNT